MDKQQSRRRSGPHYVYLRSVQAANGNPHKVFQCLHCNQQVSDGNIMQHVIVEHLSD